MPILIALLSIIYLDLNLLTGLLVIGIALLFS